MLQIRLLGQFDIRMDGKRITIPSRAGQSLFSYLTLTAGTPHRREKLAGSIWPDSSEETSRKNLRHELWRIRKVLSAQTPTNAEYLMADEFTLGFNRDADYWLDVAMLEKTEVDIQSLTSGISLYQGELLPGFYEDWIVIERDRIQSLFETKIEQLVDQLVEAERWTAVQEQSERWLALSSAPEAAYRALMLSYNGRGDMAKVSAIYQRCVDDLQDQFGVEPSAETHALYNGLLKGARAPRRIVPTQSAGTVTFLFTDIEESTNLLDKLKDQYASVLTEHHKILRDAIQKWNGREVDTQGDAFFITFSRALDAIQCAADAQRSFSSHKWIHNKPVRVRMGLHTGEPLIASTGYVGMDVHRAARIGDAAHGGQVLLSQTTRELVANDLPDGLAIRDLGEHRLKDLKFPTCIYQLDVEGLASDFPPLRTKFSGTEPPTPGEPPFKGLQFFDEADAYLFFGRELLTAKLVDRLRETQFLSVIIGASGSGKSSLVRAGLIPALKGGKELMDGVKPPAGSANWRVHVMTPTAHPIEALAIELTRASESLTATSTLMDDLMQDPRSLTLYIARQDSKQHTLLVLDQFEELFTLCRDEFEKEAFIDNLLYAMSISSIEDSNVDGGITLVLTLRADFYAHLAQYPELRDAVARQQEYIGPMTTEELRRAIEEPAKRAHWDFEPGLVDLILRDVGDEPGALPLLSHALLETWKRRAGHTLTLKGYADAGGVRGAIAQTAESVYQDLSPDEQNIARDIFLRLTELGEGTEDTRRRVSFDELMADIENAAEVHAVINLLADSRLVTLGENTAEVAHEALIREWPTLREWLNQDREGLQLHRRLTETAREWELLERDDGVLYRGAQLAQAREWAALHTKALNTGEQAFLDSSIAFEEKKVEEREAQQRRELEAAQKLAETERQSGIRLQLRNRVISVVGLIAVILAMVAFAFSRQSNSNAQSALNAQVTAQANADVAESEASIRATAQAILQINLIEEQRKRLIAEANSLLGMGESGELPALLVLQSLKIKYDPEAQAILYRALDHGFTLQKFEGHGPGVWCASFSPDGQSVLTGGIDGTIRLWNPKTGEELQRFIHEGGACPTFSPDGKLMVSGGADHTVRFWNIDTGESIRIIDDHEDYVYKPIFSPDGMYMLTYSDDHTARLRDPDNGELIHILQHPNQVNSAIFSPDGRTILTAGLDFIIREWDVQTGNQLRIFEHPNEEGIQIQNLIYAPDGKTFFSAPVNNTIYQWDVESGEILKRFTISKDERLINIDISPSGHYLIAGSSANIIYLWDVESGDLLRTYTGQQSNVYDLDFSPDEQSFVAGEEGGTPRLWATMMESEPFVYRGSSGRVHSAAFTPVGKAITSDEDGIVHIWDATTGEQSIQLPTGSENVVATTEPSPDGQYLLTSGDETILWNLQTGQEIKRFAHLSFSVTFSPDTTHILTGGMDGLIYLWNIKTGEREQTLEGHHSEVTDLKYSLDGIEILSASWDNTAILWDAQSGEIIHSFEHDGPLNTAIFHPDGERIITVAGDNFVRIWDKNTGEELQRFAAPTSNFNDAVLMPDGEHIMVAATDGTVRLYELDTGNEVGRFQGHTEIVFSLAISPDGSKMLTSSWDETARVWSLDFQDLINAVCSYLPRDLDQDERHDFGIPTGAPSCGP